MRRWRRRRAAVRMPSRSVPAPVCRSAKASNRLGELITSSNEAPEHGASLLLAFVWLARRCRAAGVSFCINRLERKCRSADLHHDTGAHCCRRRIERHIFIIYGIDRARQFERFVGGADESPIFAQIRSHRCSPPSSSFDLALDRHAPRRKVQARSGGTASRNSATSSIRPASSNSTTSTPARRKAAKRR